MLRPSVALALVAFALSCAPAARALSVETIAFDTKRGQARFTVEVAADPQSQERGLMFRRQLGANEGMLFDFHAARFVSFWMKNT
ncbi:MAG: DUF192 domain-containing protein, partial [Alphaproteobacteria bacterium]|nr:DUF192 domain-containing protein [Alphaproteobacteria bacterium]